jgi:hypothetical protein
MFFRALRTKFCLHPRCCQNPLCKASVRGCLLILDAPRNEFAAASIYAIAVFGEIWRTARAGHHAAMQAEPPSPIMAVT